MHLWYVAGPRLVVPGEVPWGAVRERFSPVQDFLVLLGDDVTVSPYHWMDLVEAEFHDLAHTQGSASQLGLYGLGCVALRDSSCPNFPSFPVLRRLHVDIHGTLLPPVFVNQDADPFLFAIYARFNASRFARGVMVTNGIGGHGPSRYDKVRGGARRCSSASYSCASRGWR